MFPTTRHLLLLMALLATSSLGAGAAFADPGGGHDHDGPHGGPGGAGGQGPGGDKGPSPGDDKGPGPGGGNGPGPGSNPNSNPGNRTPSNPGNPNPGDGDGRFHLFHPAPPPAAPPPPDGDNGVGDDADDSGAPSPVVTDDVFGKHKGHGNSPAAQFVKTPVLDQEQSKSAIQNGKAASMPLLITYLDQKYPGQVLDVKLHTTGDGLVYEVRYLANVVELRTLFLDAQTLSRK